MRKKKIEMSISSRFCLNSSFKKKLFFFFFIILSSNFDFSQKTSPSVVFIQDIELPKTSSDEENAKIEGTGSGFVWDKLGHIVGK